MSTFNQRGNVNFACFPAGCFSYGFWAGLRQRPAGPHAGLCVQTGEAAPGSRRSAGTEAFLTSFGVKQAAPIPSHVFECNRDINDTFGV